MLMRPIRSIVGERFRRHEGAMVSEATWAKLREAFEIGKRGRSTCRRIRDDRAQLCANVRLPKKRSRSGADRPTRRKGSLVLLINKGPDWIGGT